MKTLDAKLLREFLRMAGDTLSGDWLLVGGTLLPAVGLDVRATVDIDLIGLSDEEGQQTLELMKIAETLGLSVETINQAASYFLKKVGYKKKDLIGLHQGKKAMIYRPSAELFWRLKVPRLSEADLLDCQHYYHYCVGHQDEINNANLLVTLRQAIALEPTQEKLERLRKLKAIVQAKGGDEI